LRNATGVLFFLACGRGIDARDQIAFLSLVGFDLLVTDDEYVAFRGLWADAAVDPVDVPSANREDKPVAARAGARSEPLPVSNE
jgi:hypothetical protein